MPYFVVQDFKGGLNQNRIATTSTPGTLRTLRDAHINRGGEVEKRKAMVPRYSLPPGTIGLAAAGATVYVFGTPPDPGVPAPIVYQRLDPGGGVSVVEIMDVKAFGGLPYVAALCSDGAVRHFYNGTQVTVFTGQTGAEQARILLPFGGNMYGASGSVLHRSKNEDATDWNVASIGAAFFDMGTKTTGTEALTGLAEYQSNMAVFSRRTTQLWAFDPDPDASQRQQTLRNTGCVAPRTVVPFAGTDVFFLSDSGIRSLRARSGTDSPAASDVGTAIDDTVGEWLRTADALALRGAHAVSEPVDGRYWLVLGSTVYVFSYFMGAQISAWSTYSVPGPPVATISVERKVFVRVDDTIYLYGGDSGAEYDATSAIVETPYLDGRTIASWKRWGGLDIAAEGTWDVYVNTVPSDPTAEDLVGRLEGSTFSNLANPMLGTAAAVKLRFVSVGSGPAKLSSIVAHYERDRAA